MRLPQVPPAMISMTTSIPSVPKARRDVEQCRDTAAPYEHVSLAEQLTAVKASRASDKGRAVLRR